MNGPPPEPPVKPYTISQLNRKVAAPAWVNARASVVTTLFSIAPPKSGCGCATTATATGWAGTAKAISIAPAAPSIVARRVSGTFKS